MTFISQLFEPEPEQWGLRGDPCLWEEMKAMLDSVSLPKTSVELERVLRFAFEEITERSWAQLDPIFITRYDQGGMSSGMVCPDFWRNKAIPLIVSRYQTKGLPGDHSPL